MPKRAAPRRRRSAEEARVEILDAAEARLTAVGPDGIRLQEVAAEVGISHPAVLHHFGSREALVEAVVERALQRLQDDLVHALSPGEAAPGDLLERVHRTLRDGGHARLLAWLLLSGRAAASDASRRGWDQIIDATHALRQTIDPTATREDTAFTVVLSALALFGEALSGDLTFDNAGLDGTARARFRPWLAHLLMAHLGPGTTR